VYAQRGVIRPWTTGKKLLKEKLRGRYSAEVTQAMVAVFCDSNALSRGKRTESLHRVYSKFLKICWAACKIRRLLTIQKLECGLWGDVQVLSVGNVDLWRGGLRQGDCFVALVGAKKTEAGKTALAFNHKRALDSASLRASYSSSIFANEGDHLSRQYENALLNWAIAQRSRGAGAVLPR